MFRESNHVTLRTETVRGLTLYFVSIEDGDGDWHEVEVSSSVYQAFMEFTVIERRLRHWDERHREYSEVYDETLNHRALNPQESLDEIVFTALRHEQLQQGITALPEKQRRRFIMYCEYGFTHDEIAALDGCKRQVVARSVEKAKKNLKKYLKDFY